MKLDMKRLQREYRQLQRQLAAVDCISHGYAQDRGPGAGGPCYQWTRKERKKTVSVALSAEQYKAMKHAIDNWRDVQRILKRMEQISRTIIFYALPEPLRRKPPTKSVLGLI
jgi:hypothetical protein